MKVFKRIVCFFAKRHRPEKLKAAGAKFHQFYHIDGGGWMCRCPKCGARVIKERK